MLREWSRLAKPAKRIKSSRSLSRASRGANSSMALYEPNSSRTPWLARHYGRSIVPNRSEPKATVASKTKQPNSRKTPSLRVVVEPLGTMALHCKTARLVRRYGRSIVPNRSEPKATVASKTKQPNSRKTPPLRVVVEPLGTMALHCKTLPLARRAEPFGLTQEAITRARYCSSS